MNIRCRLIIFPLLILRNCFAAGDFNVTGGRAAGMGFSSVAFSDEWSAFNNPAGLARFRSYSASVYYENRFLVKEISIKSISLTIPAWKGTFGVIFSHKGFSLYNEIKAGISYGMLLGKYFSAGVQINCLRIGQGEGYGNKYLFSGDVGLQFRASEHLELGLHIVNPVSQKISGTSPDRLPALVRLGLLWKINGDLLATVEAEKDLQDKPVFRSGIEYHIAKPLFVRVGIGSDPVLFTMGVGLEFGNFRFDLASGYHLVLGYSPQASVTYRFR